MRETRLAVLENNKSVSLVSPERFSVTRTEAGFGLTISPLETRDSGTYFCLVNGRREPFSAWQLAVQGEID